MGTGRSDGWRSKDCNCDPAQGKVTGCADVPYQDVCSVLGGDGYVNRGLGQHGEWPVNATNDEMGIEIALGGTSLTIAQTVVAMVYGRILDAVVGLNAYRFMIYSRNLTPTAAAEDGVCCACCRFLPAKAQKIMVYVWIAVAVPILLVGISTASDTLVGGTLWLAFFRQLLLEYLIFEPLETVVTCLLGLHDVKMLMNGKKGKKGKKKGKTASPVSEPELD